MAEYTCNKGYILVGNKSVTCNSDGNWTVTSNQCGQLPINMNTVINNISV